MPCIQKIPDYATPEYDIDIRLIMSWQQVGRVDLRQPLKIPTFSLETGQKIVAVFPHPSLSEKQKIKPREETKVSCIANLTN